MKLLFLLTFYKPHWTGLTQYAVMLGEGLVKRGFKVTVVTTNHEEKLKAEEDINGVKVKRYPVWFRLSRTMVSIKMLAQMVTEIKNCDKAVIFLPYAEVAWAGLLAKLFNKPFYLIYNGDLVLPKGITNRVMEKVFDLFTNLAINLSNGVIVNTVDYARNSRVLSGHSDKWIELVPPFVLEETKATSKKSVGKKVGFAGRFVEEKGFDILLSAIPLVAERIPTVKFVFAGETQIPYENTFAKNQELVEKSKKWLQIAGKLAREKMVDFYKSCDVFVISSRSDFFPFVQAEALLSGVPVVVTDIPGARWLVKQSGMGEVVKPEDPEALAEGIIKVLKSPQEYKKNYGKIKEIFNYQKLIGKYEQLLS